MILKRNCPNCDKEIIHKNKRCFDNAFRKVTVCKSCATTAMHAKNPNKLTGNNNPMFNNCAENIWKNTLSKKEVELKIINRKIKKSKASSGSNNPMYGKPSPEGSGRGRSGVWHGHSFRSLLELAFLEWFCLANKYIPETAESSKWRVQLSNGHFYYPDFVDKEENIYEIKPFKIIALNQEKIIEATRKYGTKFILLTNKDLPGYSDIHLRLNSFENLSMNKRKSAQ